MPDYKSKVPYFRFPVESEEVQWEALANNPLLRRMNQSRQVYDDSFRPGYHYINPEGGLNDPNGLCYWQDKWHLFYQAYPPEDTRQHWGHAVSDDLLRWTDLPYCIYPDPEECCFSGSCFVERDRVIAMYHGTKIGNMVAVASDPLLLNWDKLGDGAVIPMPEQMDKTPPYRVFDPCLWRDGDFYYSLSAGQTRTGPGEQPLAADFLFRSKDLIHWDYLHPFAEDDRYTRVGDDGACPYFWPIGDKHILLFFSHTSGGQYLLGDYDRTNQKFNVTYGEKFNFGPVGPGGVHAPSATPHPSGDGSVIAIFNMNPAKPSSGWNQIMSMPRRLRLSDDGKRVHVSLACDLTPLYRDPSKRVETVLDANVPVHLKDIEGDCYMLTALLQPSRATAIQLDVLLSPDDEEYTRITVYRERGYWDRALKVANRTTFVVLDNSRSSIASDVMPRSPERVEVAIDREQAIDLQILVDRSIVEVFVNQQKALALRVYPAKSNSRYVRVESRGAATDAMLVFQPLDAIYP